MKKVLFAALIIAGIAACNSPQEITTGDSTSTNTMTTAPVDSSTMPSTDTTMQGDTAKRDTLR